MLRNILCIALIAAAAMLATASQAHAWGAYHVGYTHVGPEGVQHYGRTAAVGPYGAYSGAHYGAYGAGGVPRRLRRGGAYGGALRRGLPLRLVRRLRLVRPLWRRLPRLVVPVAPVTNLRRRMQGSERDPSSASGRV